MVVICNNRQVILDTCSQRINGNKCNVCDRLWFLQEFTVATVALAASLIDYCIGDETAQYKLSDDYNKVCKMNNFSPNSSNRYTHL